MSRQPGCAEPDSPCRTDRAKRITFAAPFVKRYETDDFKPSGQPRFVAVSLNGTLCELQCDHCRARMLAALYQASSPKHFLPLCESLHRRGCKGMLLTGGCDRDGTIPLHEYAAAVREAKTKFGFRIACHSKLATERFANAAIEAGVDLLMLDVVGEEESLGSVYHLPGKTPADVEQSLDLAQARGLKLAPHILIGIAHGKIAGEYRALEMLRGRPLETLCLVVLSPLRHTPMAGTRVDVEGAMEFLKSARREFPNVRIALGCAKTGGASQRKLEQCALESGFDSIAYPSEGLVEQARDMGFTVELRETCCAFAEPC